jgi:hypothetical protein
MAESQPTRTYDFTGGSNAVADAVDTDLNTLYTVLQGGLGNTHIAADAAIDWTKMASTAWTAFTPSWNNVTLGSGETNVGRYFLMGKTLFVTADLTLGTGGSVSGTLSMDLPNSYTAANQSVNYWGGGKGRTSVSASKHWVITAEVRPNVSTVRFYTDNDSSIIDNNTPDSSGWQVGDGVKFSIVLEIA